MAGCLPTINWYCGGMLGVVAPRMGWSMSLCHLSVHQQRRRMLRFQSVFDHESYPRSLCKFLKHERCFLPVAATWGHAYSTCSQIPTPWYHPIKKTFKFSNSLHHCISFPSPLLPIPSLTRTAHGCTCVASSLLMRPYQSFTLPTTREYTTSQHGPASQWRRANRSTVTYMVAIVITVVGLSYAAVPLYRLFCQASGYGGTVVVVDSGEKVEKMKPIRERVLTIRYSLWCAVSHLTL